MKMSGIAGEMPFTRPTPGPLRLTRRAAGYWNMPSTGSVRPVATGRPALVDGWHTASNRSSAGRALVVALTAFAAQLASWHLVAGGF
jgi:hypothetical protein